MDGYNAKGYILVECRVIRITRRKEGKRMGTKKSNIEDKILLANLKATEKFLREQGQGAFAYYIRQALDYMYPLWEE